MHLPLAHLSGFSEPEDEELQAQLQQQANSNSHEDEDGSQSHNSQEGSKEGSGGSAPDGTKPPKDLPCPRCQSMNTKFCYYNNYSVNQPRHFCRNCQRYWTVGGTLRNVPVGGGSRKKSRTRSRSDPYYRPGAAAASSPLPAEGDADGNPLHPDMAGDMAQLHPEFGDFPFHPSQMAAFLQLALQQQTGPGMGAMSPFLDRPLAFPMTAEEEAELQAFYDASQSGVLGSAAAMMSSGLFLPDFEPAHLALMHKATLWAEAQRLQTMARRQTAAAQWAAEEQRECKPSVASPPPVAMGMGMGMHPHSAMEAELRYRQHAHRRPGFWETALMHSRPSKAAAARPGSSSQTTTPCWDAETKPTLGETDPEENSNAAARAAAAASAYAQAYVNEEPSSWGSGLNDGTTPEMYY